MKKYIIMYSMYLITFSLSAQEVIFTNNPSLFNLNASLDFTIEEVIVHFCFDETTAPMQEPHIPYIRIIDKQGNFIDKEANVLSNPQSEMVHLEIPCHEGATYKLHDKYGEILLQGRLSSDVTSIKIGILSMDKYMFTLIKQE